MVVLIRERSCANLDVNCAGWRLKSPEDLKAWVKAKHITKGEFQQLSNDVNEVVSMASSLSNYLRLAILKIQTQVRFTTRNAER